MKLGYAALIFIWAAAWTSPVMSPAGAEPGTWSEWESYLQAAEARATSDAAGHFLWVDQAPGRCERVRNGEVIASMVDRRQLSPHGLIHDWVATTFIPDVRLADVLAVVRNYDRYSHYYGPTIHDSKLVSDNGDTLRFWVRYKKSALWVTVVLDVDYDVRYRQLSSRQTYAVTRSACVQEIAGPGHPDEHKLPCGDPRAYIWSATGISKYEERDQGVYVEEERIILSREIPAAFRFLIEPVVNRMSRELVLMSLRRTRDAVSVAVSRTP